VHQIYASDPGSNSSFASDARASLPAILEVDDLTVLTGWTEAVAEALVHAPEQIPMLVADARPGAAGRSALGIAEPTEQLAAAIESLDELLQATGPTLDAALAAAAEDRSGEQALEELVRAVLRSTLEQLCSRSPAPSKPSHAQQSVHPTLDIRA
jgi:hypothetical protein